MFVHDVKSLKFCDMSSLTLLSGQDSFYKFNSCITINRLARNQQRERERERVEMNGKNYGV